MRYIWIVGNGVAVISTIICMAYLYAFRWKDPKSHWPLVSVCIIGTTALVTGLQFVFPEIVSMFRRNWDGLVAGEWWRLITPLLVQPQGWIQCVSNAFFLLAFVPLAERVYGIRLLALYLIPGLVGQIVNYSWNPNGGGASPAAFGVMGGLLAYIIRQRSVVHRSVWLIAILGLCAAGVLSFGRDGHGPSLLAGAILGSVLQARRLPALKKSSNDALQPIAPNSSQGADA